MTKQNPVLPTEEQFSQRMKEAYGMLDSCTSIEDISAPGGPLSHIFKDTIEAMLKAEMTEHLGYEHNDVRSKDTDNATIMGSANILRISGKWKRGVIITGE